MWNWYSEPEALRALIPDLLAYQAVTRSAFFFGLRSSGPPSFTSARQPSLSATLRAKAGGAEGIRTPDLLIANQPLYQLSYDPSQCRPIPDDNYYAVLRPDDKYFWQ